MNYAKLLEKISREAFEALEKITDVDFNHKTNGKWSRKEILGHLIDSAYNNHRRVLIALQQDHMIFDGYMQDLWVEKNNYQSRHKEDLVITWKMCNLHFAEFIQHIPSTLLEKKYEQHNLHEVAMFPYDTNKAATLSRLIWDYIAHVEHHLDQIISNYEKQLKT